jgi:hypothetical protein
MSLHPLFVQGVAEGDLFVDELATFEAGMVGQLQLSNDGLNPEVTVSDGTFPYGLFDDDKTNSFIVPHYQEPMTLRGTEISVLKFAPIVPDSMIIKDLLGNVLDPNLFQIYFTNGALARKVPSNPPDNSTSGLNIVVSYQNYVQGIPEVDSTLGSSRVSVWTISGRYGTDIFDTTASYYINDLLFAGDGVVAPKGMISTKKPSNNGPSIGSVVIPPTPTNSTLQFMFKTPIWHHSPSV